MALIEIDHSIEIPGEKGLVALCGLLEKLADKATAEQIQQLTQRVIELTEPYHKIKVAISKNLAEFIGKLLKIDVEKVKL